MSIRFFIVYSFYPFISCRNEYKAESTEKSKTDAFKELLKIEVYDSTGLTLVDTNANIEILATGFYWSEGPLWVDELQAVLFSDVPANKIYQWSEKDGLLTYLESAGHTGMENKDSGLGPNGLTLDLENKLLICQHGDRRIARMEADLNKPQPQFTTIAGKYAGKQLNSPNDMVMDPCGQYLFHRSSLRPS